VVPSSRERSSVLSRLPSADGFTVFDRSGRRTAPAVIGFLAVLGVAAALYASGPEYIVKSGGRVSVICIEGRVANFVWVPAPRGFCVDKRNGTYRPRAELVRHTAPWERLYYAVVGTPKPA
jgi:hypothetical protein